MDAALLARVASFLGNAAPLAATPAASAPAAAPAAAHSPQPDVGSTAQVVANAVQQHVHMIVFSKDRAFQLHQLLLSAKAHLDTSNTQMQISVLYLASEAFTASYEHVAEQHPQVDFVAELPGCFFEQLQTLVAASSTAVAAAAFILFAVDDIIFYAQPSFPLATATAALSSKPSAYGAQLKLSPCITHSHAAASACKVPALQFIDKSAPTLQLFEFEPESVRGGANDWDYAWDLTGGLYRQADVAELLISISALHANDATAADRKRAALNPNLLELYGNQALRAQWAAAAAQQRTMLCAGAPVLSAITINRVQTTFATPVYDSTNGDVHELDKRLWRGEVVDTAWYSAQQFRSVHIAELVLKSAKSAPAAAATAVPMTADSISEGISGVQIAVESATKPLVSVLLPVHNGEQWLRIAVQSILAQTFTAFELIIIDDGSSDSSVQCISDLVHSDARIVLVQQQQQRGLAQTLNNGLQLARCELVARMDADDVAVPRRLQRQYSYMQAHPSVQVLGTAVATFSGNGNPLQSANCTSSSSSSSDSSISSSSSGSVCAQRVVVHPTDAAVLEWELLFSCCIAHPSVMLRKSAVLDNSSIAGYSKSAEPAEDYTLWLQLLAAARTNSSSSSGGDSAAAAAAVVAAVTDGTTSSGVVFACLGEVLLWHRKHTRSASAAQLQLQQAKALQAATQAVTALLSTTTNATTQQQQQQQQQLVNERFVAVLRAPETAATIAEATGALQLLLALADSSAAAAQRCGCTDEAMVIRERANARLAALACTAMSKFGSAAAPLLQQWTQRCPGASPGSMLMALSTALSSSN
jgi:Glycosyl transferase family 2